MKHLKQLGKNNGFCRVRSFDAVLRIDGKSASTSKKIYAMRDYAFDALRKAILAAQGVLSRPLFETFGGHLAVWRAPKSAQVGPKSAQVEPKSDPSGSKCLQVGRPGGAEERPSGSQERPSGPQECPSWPQERPSWPQERSNWPRDGSARQQTSSPASTLSKSTGRRANHFTSGGNHSAWAQPS